MTETFLESTRKSLLRVQTFDVEKLPRIEELGTQLSFIDAKAPAERIINLFKKIPIEYLGEIAIDQVNYLQSHADTYYNNLNDILKFDPKTDPPSTRSSLIDGVSNSFQHYFNQLHPIISYCASLQRDFAGMEREFRSKMQSSEDKATATMQELEDRNKEAEKILAEVRKVAAEQGVSQQALYFQQESMDHDKEAASWKNLTIWTSILLVIYAICSAFAHKLEWLTPSDAYQAFQLGLSKILIFVVLAYMLLLCARNFLSHKHNSIVNKHRQNALLTFNALVDAAGNTDRRDVILTYAAACIFSPQDTGYVKGGSGVQLEMPPNIIQALPNMASAGSNH